VEQFLLLRVSLARAFRKMRHKSTGGLTLQPAYHEQFGAFSFHDHNTSSARFWMGSQRFEEAFE